MTKKIDKLIFAAWACENKKYASYQCWYSPLKSIFSKVILFDPQKNSLIYGREAMNEKLLELIKKEKPDFIFFWLTYDAFSIETLLKIKEISPKTKTINFFGDDDTQFECFTRYYAHLFDYSILFIQLPSRIYKKEGINNILMSHGVNLDNFKPLNLNKKYDVTFIGLSKNDRYELIKFLKDNNIDVKVFGPTWDKHHDLKDICGGQLNQEELVKVINQSKINLGFSKNFFNKPHFKSRAFEIGACNSFCLLEYFSGYLNFLRNNKEIVMFKDKEDLLKKIRYYLQNEKERENIANKLYKRVIKDYNLHKDLQKFFKKISKDKPTIQKSIPKSSKRIVILTEKDIELAEESLKEKLKKADYIAFQTRDSIHSKYKNEIQAYSLDMSKKQISCCDYYLSSKKIGDYAVNVSKDSFFLLNNQEFAELLDINQIMVTKEYFFRNLKAIRDLFSGKKVNLIQEENTAFISIPLVKIFYPKKINYNAIKKIVRRACFFIFEEKLISLFIQKRLFTSSFLYLLLLESIKPGRRFILWHLLESVVSQSKLKSIKKLPDVE